MNPYLTLEGWDSVKNSWHCCECQIVLLKNTKVVETHYVVVWTHLAKFDYPDIKDTDERGMTLEEVIKVPARTEFGIVPVTTQTHYCEACFPLQLRGEGLCSLCGEPVNEEEDHSKVQWLLRQVDGVNRGLSQGSVHHECLPNHFSKVHEYKLKYRK